MMIKRIIERWKELREEGFLQLSIKDTIIQMIKETIRDKWESFIVNRYGRESHFLAGIVKKDLEEFDYGFLYGGLAHLYYDSESESKEQLLNKLLVTTKLLKDYEELLMYTNPLLKTKARTEQYREASFRVYSQASLFVNWGGCDDNCEHCHAYIKEESDKIRKGLKIK
tara:strand:+ start:126 stop:632 length:507 start_codon:yes stop_codon:yes gene_type:complete